MTDEHKHFVGKIAQKALIEMNGKILICQGAGDSVWEFPGGRLHTDEEPIDGLKRELKEELGVDVPITRAFFVGRSLFRRDNTWRILVGWHGILPIGTTLNVDDAEVQKYRWVPKDELLSVNLFDDCRAMADTFLKNH